MVPRGTFGVCLRMPERNDNEIAFADIVLDRHAMTISRGGRPVDVEPQVFEMIDFLVRNAGKVMSKDDLVDVIWQGRIVSDSAIASRISAARKALGDDGKTQVEELWSSRKIQFYHVTSVNDGDWVYGSSGARSPAGNLSGVRLRPLSSMKLSGQ